MNIQRQASSPSHNVFAGTTGQFRQQVVDRQRQEDAGHDRQLLQRAEPPADARRRGLRDVHRRDDGGHADADAADDPEHHQHPDAARQSKVKVVVGAYEVVGKAGTDRADQEQQRRDLHHGYPADLVGEPACGDRAGGRPEQRRRHREAQLETADAELVLDRRHRAVDYRAVIAEQQARRGPPPTRFGRRDRHARFPRSPHQMQNHQRVRESCDALPQHCVMRITFNHLRPRQAVRSPNCELSSA